MVNIFDIQLDFVLIENNCELSGNHDLLGQILSPFARTRIHSHDFDVIKGQTDQPLIQGKTCPACCSKYATPVRVSPGKAL